MPKQSPTISVSFVNFCDVFVLNLRSKTNVDKLFSCIETAGINCQSVVAEAGFRDLISRLYTALARLLFASDA